MPAEIIGLLDWVARVAGIIVVLGAPIGFVFREKWKQMLQRSLVRDMEQIKHDFQQKLEAYKVALIAEAEAAKAKQELKKSIALRYAEIEFERLVELEQIITPLTYTVLRYARRDVSSKTVEQLALALEKSDEFDRAVERAEIFITLQDERKFLEHKKLLQNLMELYVGPNKPGLVMSNPAIDNLLKSNITVNDIVRGRIKQLGKL